MKSDSKLKSIFVATLLSGLMSASCFADSASGTATGKRQHKPFTPIKTLDKASPVMANEQAPTLKPKVPESKSSGYRLCPDGTMIQPGEKCPEKRTTK